MPRISVVIPAYNASAHIVRAVATVKRQSFQDVEIVVVNDGSTDETPDLLDRISENDGRVVVVHQSNSGRSVARNVGIARASGEFVCFLDADDLFHRERLDRLVRLAEDHPECPFVVDDQIGFVVTDGAIALRHRYNPRSHVAMGVTHVVNRRRWFLDQDCAMRPFVRREYLDEIGASFPDALDAGEDLSFGLQLAFGTDQPIVRFGEVGYFYREGESSRAVQESAREAVIVHAFGVTHSTELLILNRRVERSNRFVNSRNDHRYARSGRQLGDADSGAFVRVSGSSVRGYSRLAASKIMRIAGQAAHRSRAPELIAEIGCQLDRLAATEPRSTG